MLDKTNDDEVRFRQVDGAAPAVFVRYTSRLGEAKGLELSFGIPLDMTPRDVNKYLDKVRSIADRQELLGAIEGTKNFLKRTEIELLAAMENRASLEAKFAVEWENSNRKGPMRLSGAQEAQVKGFATTETHLREQRIPEIKKQIADMEAKINEDG